MKRSTISTLTLFVMLAAAAATALAQPEGGQPTAALERFIEAWNSGDNKQLRKAIAPRIAVVIIEDLTWWRFEFSLENNYIDWKNPRYLHADSVWDQFVEKQQPRYPDLQSDLEPTIRALDAVWIVRQAQGFQFDRELEADLRA